MYERERVVSMVVMVNEVELTTRNFVGRSPTNLITGERDTEIEAKESHEITHPRISAFVLVGNRAPDRVGTMMVECFKEGLVCFQL